MAKYFAKNKNSIIFCHTDTDIFVITSPFLFDHCQLFTNGVINSTYTTINRNETAEKFIFQTIAPSASKYLLSPRYLKLYLS